MAAVVVDVAWPVSQTEVKGVLALGVVSINQVEVYCALCHSDVAQLELEIAVFDEGASGSFDWLDFKIDAGGVGESDQVDASGNCLKHKRDVELTVVYGCDIVSSFVRIAEHVCLFDGQIIGHIRAPLIDLEVSVWNCNLDVL